MRRDWQRLIRRGGVRLWLGHLAVLLLLGIAYYEYADDYVIHLEQSAEWAQRLAVVEDAVERGPVFQAHAARLSAGAQWVQRAYPAPNAEAALNAVNGDVTRMLKQEYFDHIQLQKGSVVGSAPMGRINIEAGFEGVPQQLSRLEDALVKHPRELRVGDMRVAVVEGDPPVEPHLAISASLWTLWARSETPAPAPKKPVSAP